MRGGMNSERKQLQRVASASRFDQHEDAHRESTSAAHVLAVGVRLSAWSVARVGGLVLLSVSGLGAVLVRRVLAVPLVCVVVLVARRLGDIAVHELARLDRELVAVPEVIATSLVERLQLHASERGDQRENVSKPKDECA